MLYIFGGLPGTGKSTLSALLARKRRACYVRLDAIEQAVRAAGAWEDGSAGYVVAYRMAAQNLAIGVDVVADTVNPLGETRQAWREVAESAGSPFVEIEVVCSDIAEHRARVESRVADIAGLVLPTWQRVAERRLHYDPWTGAHIVLDTAGRAVGACMEELSAALESA